MAERQSNRRAPSFQSAKPARRRRRKQNQQPLELIEFFTRHFEPSELAGCGYSYRQNHRGAIRHLKRTLGQTPRVADLTTANLNATIQRMLNAGKKMSTVRICRGRLLHLAQSAHAAGLLKKLPTPQNVPVQKRPPVETLNAEELSRLLLAAKSLPTAPAETDHPSDKDASCWRVHAGCDGIPGHLWWPAFLLVLFESDASISTVLNLQPSAFQFPNQLEVESERFHLQPITVDAVTALHSQGVDRPRLFPWTLDNRRQPFQMLNRAYRTLLHRAGLQAAQRGLLSMLQKSGRHDPDLLSRIDLQMEFEPVAGQPLFARPESRRTSPREEQKSAEEDPNSLWGFFQRVYRRKRLAGKSPDAVEEYESALRRFDESLERTATLDDLNDDAIEELLAWAIEKRKVKNITANKYARHVLALWRYAYKKRLVDELPRDVEFLPEPKSVPDAWSQKQLVRLLQSCREETGTIAGIPAGQFWVTLVLLVYDTGIRLNALLSLRIDNLDLETGWLRVPADVQKQKAEQVFQLHARTLELLLQTNPADRELLFPWPWSGANHTKHFYPRLDRILKRAGLPHSARDKIHKLRRTHATYYADVAGEAAAQRQLGHSSIHVTRRYIDPTKLTRCDHPADVMLRPDWEAGE